MNTRRPFRFGVVAYSAKSAQGWAAKARWNLAPAAVRTSAHALLGPVADVVEQLQARRERFRISYTAVFEPAMEAFAPVVAYLLGR